MVRELPKLIREAANSVVEGLQDMALDLGFKKRMITGQTRLTKEKRNNI